MTIASSRQPNERAQREPFGFTKLWKLLTQCDAEGCEEPPVHLGWCVHHAPEYLPGPDEYWGDEWGDEYWGDDHVDDPRFDQRWRSPV